MSPVRFAVAGLKHFHILEFVTGMNQLPGAQFVGFFDDDPQLRKRYEQEFSVRSFETLEELVQRSEPEVVGVAEAHGRKAQTICQLVSLGCHALVDKPLVTSLEQLDRVQQAAADTGRQVGLMLLERYHGPTRVVREKLLAGELGRLVNFSALAPHKLNPDQRPDWMFHPELYGGVLNDLTIHNVDIARWMWGEEPVAVTASEGCLRFRQFCGFTDHAEVFLEFSDSSTAMIRADWLTPQSFPAHGDGRQFYECTEGTIEVASAPDIHTLGQGRITYDPWNGPRSELPPAAPKATLYEEFVELCRGATTAELLAEDGFRSTRLTLFAREAARTKQRIDLRGRL